MDLFKNKKVKLTLVLSGLFVLVGTYNSVVINSESYLSGAEIKFVKRLDEVYGLTVAGREVAATVTWQKLSSKNALISKPFPVVQVASRTSDSSAVPSVEETVPEAALQEELNLSLVEVNNPMKWKKGLTTAEFSGSLKTNNGVIESLAVSLPNGEGLDVSFSEMVGNVFEYDFDGQVYSGMMYQVDQFSYMVTLSNGPLEGTRLNFSSNPSGEEIQKEQEYLADNNVEPGNFGDVTAQAEELNPEQMAQVDQEMQENAIQAQSFNLDQNQTM